MIDVSEPTVLKKLLVSQFDSQTALAKLPKGYDYDWAGSSKDQAEQGNESIFIFMICLLFIYLLLSAQYESFILPLAVLISLPIGIFGSLFFLYIFGLENNTIEEGAKANLTLFTTEGKSTFTKEDILSKSKNSAFLGTDLKGSVYGIFNQNQLVTK